MRQPRERRAIGMCTLCRVEERTVGVSSLSGILSAPPLGMAYCLAKPGLALIQCQHWLALLQRLDTWLTLLQCLARGLSHICLLQLSRQHGWHLDADNQGISNGQFIQDTFKPSYLPRINSLFIMYTGIIRNNSLVGRCALAEANLSRWVRHALLHITA